MPADNPCLVTPRGTFDAGQRHPKPEVRVPEGLTVSDATLLTREASAGVGQGRPGVSPKPLAGRPAAYVPMLWSLHGMWRHEHHGQETNRSMTRDVEAAAGTGAGDTAWWASARRSPRMRRR